MTSSGLQALADIVGSAGHRDPRRYMVGGAAPAIAVAPATAEEAAGVLSVCAADSLGCLVVGGMSRMSCCPRLDRYQVALVTERLLGFEHHAADMMCTIGAGEQLRSVNEALHAAGQWLPWEAEIAGPSTVGGAIATDCSGACEDGFGPPRRRVLEAVAVTGSGEVIRVGAKVTKSAAGYGVHRLLCGSWGSLAVLVETTVVLASMPGRALYAIRLGGWAETAYGLAVAERLSPHLVSFTITADEDGLCAVYDAVGDEPTLAWIESEVGGARRNSSNGIDCASAIRFQVDRTKAGELARALHDAFPHAAIRWRPLSGVVWLLHSAPAEDWSKALALAGNSSAMWRAERGSNLGPWTRTDCARRLRDLITGALDPHRIFIGEALRGGV